MTARGEVAVIAGLTRNPSQGIYVDAPNGRSYLYEFNATPVAGVEFEKRAALLSPLVSDRGKLHLQPFA